VLASDRKAVVILRNTRLQELIARFQTAAQAKFYVEHLGADFSDYEREHESYVAAKGVLMAALEPSCRVQQLERAFLPTFLFGPDDVVFALGQDGLVANTLKYLNGQQLVGVNPEPRRYDGVLLPFEPKDVSSLLDDVFERRRPLKAVTMAKASLSDGQVLYAVNDLFIGPKSHTSARYELAVGDRREVQSSSGLIVSTGLGSTAWLKSIVTGSAQIAESMGADTQHLRYQAMPWDAPYLRFAVREPFPSISSRATLVCGKAEGASGVAVRSLMPENGVIFSDGVEADYLEFKAGITAIIGVAERVGQLVH
jgi:NAD kinase